VVTARRFRAVALSLPEAEERETWGEATVRVRARIFAIMSPDGKRASIKASPQEQAALIHADPRTYSPAPYVGKHGWVAVELRTADGDEVGELLTEAWRLTAPKRLVAALDGAAQSPSDSQTRR